MEGLDAPRGLIVDLITPFRADGAIDEVGLGRLLEKIIPFAQAILLAGPEGGEGKKMEPSRRTELLQKALPIIRERVPVFVWVTQETPQKTKTTVITLRNLIDTQRYSGPVFWVDSPLYYHSNRGLPDYYKEICSAVDEPFILHNDPKLIKEAGAPLKRNNLRTAILKELAGIKNIVGIIFSGSLDRAHHYQKAVRARTSFRIYDGDENHFLDHPSMSGVVSIGANLAPAAWQRIAMTSLHLGNSHGDYPDSLRQVWEVGRYLRELKDAYQQMPAALVKEILADMGMIETPVIHSHSENFRQSADKLRDLMTSYNNYSS